MTKPDRASAKPAAKARPTAKPRTTPAPAGSAGVDDAKRTMTTYISRGDRVRANAAFRATAHLEGDESWSDFVAKAIRAETERRERAYGGPFTGGEAPLPHWAAVEALAPVESEGSIPRR